MKKGKPVSGRTTDQAGAARAAVREVNLPKPDGQDAAETSANAVVTGLGIGASIASAWSNPSFPQGNLDQMYLSLANSIKLVANDDLGHAEAMLVSQAVALNALFGELVRRAGMNIGEHLDATERYMRLALKAQSQSRATLETLATIKNPPVVFAKQANVNNGGQQQINNGVAAADAGRSGESKPTAVTHARGEILDFGQSKVLTRMSVNASEPPNTADSLATHAVNGRDSQPLGN